MRRNQGMWSACYLVEKQWCAARRVFFLFPMLCLVMTYALQSGQEGVEVAAVSSSKS